MEAEIARLLRERAQYQALAEGLFTRLDRELGLHNEPREQWPARIALVNDELSRLGYEDEA